MLTDESLNFIESSLIPPPDLEICIELEQSNKFRLYFSLHSRSVGYVFADFGSVEFVSSPLEKMQAIYKNLSQMIHSPPNNLEQKDYAIRRLSCLGNNLWDELIPYELSKEYWNFRSQVQSVLITSDEPWIPWEWIKPYRYCDGGKREDDPFWCQQFSMSRWMSGPAPLDEVLLGTAIPVAPKNTNLQAVKEEVSFIQELHDLHPGIAATSPLCNRMEVLDWLENEDFSILHFACHGIFDVTLPNNSSISLSDGSLCSSDIQTRFIGSRPRPMIFINACYGARVNFNFTCIGGWAAQLLKARVGVFIGAIWEVSDDLALKFTRSFYSLLLQKNMAIAEAFRLAREEIRQIAPHDPTWLAYVLYADPNSKVKEAPQLESLNLRSILLDLKSAIELESELADGEKIEALEQLKLIAISAIFSDTHSFRRSIKSAILILNKIAANLSDKSNFLISMKKKIPHLNKIIEE